MLAAPSDPDQGAAFQQAADNTTATNTPMISSSFWLRCCLQMVCSPFLARCPVMPVILAVWPAHQAQLVGNSLMWPAGSGSPSSMRAASTSSAGSAWASDITDQPLSGSPASAGTHHHADRRRRGEHPEHLAGQVSSSRGKWQACCSP